MLDTFDAPTWNALTPALVAGVSAAIAAGLILVLRPLFVRFAMAAPTARSSHATPTPQGGGIAVMTATVVVAAAALYLVGSAIGEHFWLIAAAAVLLTVSGAADDAFSMGIVPRLAVQAIAVVIAIWSLPGDLRIVPFLPWPVERSMLFIGLLWFVNLVNFMDGIDWMSVGEVVPVTAALSILGLGGALPPEGVILALTLLGAVVGFAPFNRPVARLFLGDSGSLPIGLLLGWLLILLAGNGHVAAALLLPLYYLADATITLGWRRWKRERLWDAHRSHYYQRATERGFTVMRVVAHVLALNVVLAILAVLTVRLESPAFDAAAVVAGAILVLGILAIFARGGR